MELRVQLFFFFFVLSAEVAGRSVQSYEKSFFSIFSQLNHFPQDFGQVKGWVMLELYKIK